MRLKPGRCIRCGKILKSQRSLQRGYGDICFVKRIKLVTFGDIKKKEKNMKKAKIKVTRPNAKAKVVKLSETPLTKEMEKRGLTEMKIPGPGVEILAHFVLDKKLKHEEIRKIIIKRFPRTFRSPNIHLLNLYSMGTLDTTNPYVRGMMALEMRDNRIFHVIHNHVNRKSDYGEAMLDEKEFNETIQKAHDTFEDDILDEVPIPEKRKLIWQYAIDFFKNLWWYGHWGPMIKEYTAQKTRFNGLVEKLVEGTFTEEDEEEFNKLKQEV